MILLTAQSEEYFRSHQIARAVGQDAANRRMRAAGRSNWSRSHHQVATVLTLRILRELGQLPPTENFTGRTYKSAGDRYSVAGETIKVVGRDYLFPENWLVEGADGKQWGFTPESLRKRLDNANTH